jgi:hypothetical protein
MAWTRIGVFPNRLEAEHYCNSNGYGNFDRNYNQKGDGSIELFILQQSITDDDGRTKFTGTDNWGRLE